MKKYPLVVLFVLTLVLTGCAPQMQRGRGQADFLFPDSISVPFSATFGIIEAKGNINYSDSQLTIEFTEPKTIDGLTVKVNKDETSFSVNNLTVTKVNNPILDKLNINVLFHILNDAKENANVSKTRDGFLVSGGTYEIEFDSECNIRRITVPEREIEITVSV